MKYPNAKAGAFFAISLMILMSACKDGKKEIEPELISSNGMTCTINNQKWNSVSFGTKIMLGDTVPSDGIRIIFQKDTMSMSFVGINNGDTSVFIFSGILNPGKIGQYTEKNGSFVYIPRFDPLVFLDIYQNYTIQPKFNITYFNESKKLVSANFSLEMTSNSGGKAFSIKNGSFEYLPFESL